MKTLTTTLVFILLAANLFGQLRDETGIVLVAPFEYALYEITYEEGRLPVTITLSTQNGKQVNSLNLGDGHVNFSTISKYLFDDDDDIEFMYYTGGGEGLQTLHDFSDGAIGISIPTIFYHGSYKLEQREDGTYFVYSTHSDYPEETIKLPGNLPQVEQSRLLQALHENGTRTPDTVYLERVTRDTVYLSETITERIYTSDTVYISETINVASGTDTVVIEKRLTTRDTVYNYTENTISRVDSIYLLGGDYLDDLNRVTSIENQLEVERLGHPYPNPASETVSIDYVTEVPTTDMFLGVYDNQGRRVEEFPVRAASQSHTTTFDVSDWAPGVYVYMIWSSVGVSSTKRLMVE